MSKCGYYSCFKGKPTCNHPTYREQYTDSYGFRGGAYSWCEFCKKRCGGIYPSQVPHADQSEWKQDVVDKNGNVLN